MDKLEQGDIGGYIDLESGGTTREEDRSKDPLPANAPKKKSLKRAFGGVLRFEGSAKSKPGLASNTLRYGEVARDRIASPADRYSRENRPANLPFPGKMQPKEKQPITNSRKPPKPPRPPKAPLLNDADRKLATDAAEVATRKRARIEQMRTLKKKGATNASSLSTSSSNSTIIAMFITVLFFIIMIYQGLRSQNTVVALHQHHSESDLPYSDKSLVAVEQLKKTSLVPPDPSNSTWYE